MHHLRRATCRICIQNKVQRSRPNFNFNKTCRQGQGVLPISIDSRPFSSTLYTSPSQGEQVAFVLKPEVDFERILGDPDGLNMNVNARGQEINVAKLVSMWKKLKYLEREKSRIEGERSEVKKQSQKLSRSTNTSTEEKQELQLLGRSLREELRQITASLTLASDEFYPQALKLPNDLHENVPRGSTPKILECFGSDQDVNKKSQPHQLSEPLVTESHPLVRPGFSYLQDEAALLEFALTSWASQELLAQGFIPLTCPAMFKPITLEAMGLDLNSTNGAYAVETQDSVAYLTGVSPLGFLAYYMMTVIEAADLPHRCFTIGRSYNSQLDSSEFVGLHRNFQSQRVELCGVCENSLTASEALFTQFLNISRSLLSNLGLHFRIVEVPSAHLLTSMYRKCAIEVWIPNMATFSEVASVSSCTDYVSRRLKMRYPAIPTQRAAQSRQRKFLHTVHCEALNTSSLLAALLPSMHDKIPDVLKHHMPQPVTSQP